MPSVSETPEGFMVDGTFVAKAALSPDRAANLSAMAGQTDFSKPQGGQDWTNPTPAGGGEPGNAAFLASQGAKAARQVVGSDDLGGGTQAYLRGPNDAYMKGMGELAAGQALPDAAPPSAPPGVGVLANEAPAEARGAAPSAAEVAQRGQANNPEGMATKFALSASGPSGGGGARPSGLLGANTKEMDAAYREQADAMREGAKVGAARAGEQAAYAQTAADNAEKMAAQNALKQQQRQQALAEQTKKLQDFQDDFNKTSTKIDPSRWWGSRDTGQKILAGLGVFLGAFGHGGNAALGIIQKAVENDIDAQKTQLQANLQKKGKGVEFQQNLLGQMRQNFGDDIAAEAATRSTMLENTKMRLQAMGAKYDAPEIAAKTQAAIGALDEQKSKADFEFKTRMATLGIEKEKADAEMEKANISKMSAVMEGKNQGKDRLVPGLGYALDTKAAESLRTAHANYKDLNGLLQQAITLRQKYGSEDIGPHKAEMKSLGAQIKAAIAKDDSLRLSEAGLGVLDQMTGGDINSWGYVQPALERLKQNVNQSFMNKANSMLDTSMGPAGGGAGVPGLRPLGNG